MERPSRVGASTIGVVAVDDCSTVGDVSIVVEHYPVAAPVASPMSPTPSESSEEADTKSDTEGQPDAAPKDPRHRIPAWICDDRLAIDGPGIIRRHIDHLRIGGFDDDRVALSRYLLLFGAVQAASFPSLLTQRLDGIRHILLLIGVSVAKG